MCSHVNCLDSTHLVSWLLVNLPHLCHLVTLLICSLYNLLVFAVLCEFDVECCLCHALPVWFPFRGIFFCLLFHFIINKALFPPAIESLLSSLPPSLTEYAWLKLMSHSLTRKSYYHTANSDSNCNSWYWFCEILDWFHNNTANTVFGETKSMLFQKASHLEIFTVVKKCGEKKNAI